MSTRKYLTQSEITRLLSACRFSRYVKRDTCLIYLCYIHGLRASEALSLRLSDLDLESGQLYIHRLKNGFSVNHPLIDEELPFIHDWLNERSTWRGSEQPWLFLSERGTSITRQRFYQLFTRLGEIAELDLIVHPHMLRHACGYALANRGTDTRLIQDYLGHINIRHTVHYTASNPARFKGVWDMDDAGKN